jgi:phytoene desaturase
MAKPFATVGRNPGDSYDAVVIGAGVGGLVCATLLARVGLHVLLIEQHYVVGGYCSTFRRGGYTFDAATHFYPLLGNPDTITGRLLRDLRVQASWIAMDPVDRFHLPDGSQFSVPADYHAYRRLLSDRFPHATGELDRFFDLVRSAYAAGLLYYFSSRRTNAFADLESLTLSDVLDRYITDPKLRLLLCADSAHWGSPASRTSFVFDSMLRLGYFLGNYYPRGGSQAFVDALARRFEELGGDILINARVNRVIVRHNTARGVDVQIGPARMRNSRRIDARAVVSNADLLQTVCELVGVEHVDRSYVESVRRLRPTLACFLTHIGLRGMPGDVLERAHGYYWRSWDPDGVGRDALLFKIFVPTLYDPAMAPDGHHVLIVQKLVDVDYAATTDWRAHKAALEAEILANLERIMPGITGHITVKLSATAQTSFRYTLNHHGAMLGWEMSPHQLGDGRPAVVSPVRDLYFVGHWTRPGGGITPVMISAMQAASHIAARHAGTSEEREMQSLGVSVPAPPC